MSAPEHFAGGEPGESRSSIKVVRNAKGDTQVEVKVYSGEEDEELERIRRLAVANYEALLEELRIGRAA